MKIAWVTYLCVLSRINVILIPQIPAHPPILPNVRWSAHGPSFMRVRYLYVPRAFSCCNTTAIVKKFNYFNMQVIIDVDLCKQLVELVGHAHCSVHLCIRFCSLVLHSLMLGALAYEGSFRCLCYKMR